MAMMNAAMEMSFAMGPARIGLADAWERFGDLVDEASTAPTLHGARDAVTSWLERHIGTSASFVARLADGAPESYLRHVEPEVRDRLFEGIDRYAPAIARFTELSLAENGALVRPLERVEATGGALVREILMEARAPVGVFGVVTLGKLPVLHVYLGHERALDEERPLIAAALRVLGMAEMIHRAPAPVVELLAPAESANDARLTPREREVLEYLALGYTNAEIATACGNAANTVKRQLGSIFQKLGVCTRAEAVRIAMLEGYVVPRTARRIQG